jgi:hypothetical protein
MLVVYDGSPKSKEALFVSAYFAGRYGANLYLCALDDGTPDLEAEISYAKTYLRKLNLDFEYMLREGEDLADKVLAEAAATGQPPLCLAVTAGIRCLTACLDPILTTCCKKPAFRC